MKNILSFLFIFGLCLSIAFAQEEEKEEKKKEPVPETESRDRLAFQITFDNWIHDVDSLSTRWNSFGFSFYFHYDLKFGTSRFSFAPGIGVSSSFVKNNSYFEETDTAGTILRPWPDNDQSYIKNKNSLVTVYFDVPVEFRYRSRPNKNGKSVKVSLGAKAGVLMDGHTKRKYEDQFGNTKKVKKKGYVDLNRFRFGPTFRIGYGAFNVVAYYSVLSLFKNDEGPDVHPYSVGISINGL